MFLSRSHREIRHNASGCAASPNDCGRPSLPVRLRLLLSEPPEGPHRFAKYRYESPVTATDFSLMRNARIASLARHRPCPGTWHSVLIMAEGQSVWARLAYPEPVVTCHPRPKQRREAIGIVRVSLVNIRHSRRTVSRRVSLFCAAAGAMASAVSLEEHSSLRTTGRTNTKHLQARNTVRLGETALVRY